jgi:hypothetical protein
MSLLPKKISSPKSPGAGGCPGIVARPPLSGGEARTRLDEIADAIKSGARPETFKGELDRLLGTEMDDRDAEAEAHWEEEYRNGEPE